MISTVGSKAQARPIAIDWRWPPESWATSALRLGMWISSESRVARASDTILGLLRSRRPRTVRVGSRPEEQVAGDIHRVAERKVLIDHLDPSGARFGRAAEAHRLAIELDRARVRQVGAGEDLGQRRLAGGVVADQAQHLARPEVEIDPAQRLDAAERLANAAHAHAGYGRAVARPPERVDRA